MGYIVCSYDISSNKDRRKISNHLIYWGCIRIQKSVFIGHIKHVRENTFMSQVKNCVKAVDKVCFFRVRKEDLSSFTIPLCDDEDRKILIELITPPSTIYFG